MEKEFIPYEQALALEELGFDEDCFSDYFSFNNVNQTLEDDIQLILNQESIDDYCEENNLYPFHICSAPLYQQAARYLYIKSNNKINIQLNGSDDIEELNRKIKQGIQDLRNLQNNKSNQ